MDKFLFLQMILFPWLSWLEIFVAENQFVWQLEKKAKNATANYLSSASENEVVRYLTYLKFC